MHMLVDSTVISNFASVHSLSLLQKIFDFLYIPLEVYHEILNGQREG